MMDGMIESIVKSKKSQAQGTIISGYESALRWIKNNTIPEQGVVVSSNKKVPYLEVSGYLIPTLIDAGEILLAQQYAEFLSYMQRPNGSFAGPDGMEYVFDSGQILRGLNCAAQHWNKYSPIAQKTADYIISCIKENGKIPSTYGESIPESVHTYVLPALLESGLQFGIKEYSECAKRSIEYYKGIPGILDISTLTHFLSYTVDGFIECGEQDFVKSFVEKIFSTQRSNGSIPGMSGVKWTCSTGLAQLAIIGYKMGLHTQSDSAIRYLCRIQNKSGGFFGSYGSGASYFPKEEISWSCKFFLDAIHLKVSSFFDRNVEIFPTEIGYKDGRLIEVISQLGNIKDTKILDAGCGKGRFASKIKEIEPSAEIYGVDISEKILQYVPEKIKKKKGTILNLPFEDESFDGVYCIEALEHALRIERAIDELCRVLKNNGRIVIIDKNLEKLGKLVITDFEQWFKSETVKSYLEKNCCDVRIRKIGYESQIPDGLFLSWAGTKKSNMLDKGKWHDAMIGETLAERLVDKIKSNAFPTWSKPLLQRTSPVDSMLELGSGTGELSAILGKYGRTPILLDFSRQNIDFSREVFGRLDIEAEFICADVLIGLPFVTGSIDWVWSSGLLEHFSDEQIIGILKESKRVSRKGVISLVPNASSIPYRVGKHRKEKNGSWIYGRETPKFSMRELFKEAGLENIHEHSVGIHHALTFLENHDDIKGLYEKIGPQEVQKMNQGYLLFTVGEKIGGSGKS